MNNVKQNFTIKDLENISGIKAHTIRIWEKRYNLLQPQRTETNIRYYSLQNLQKLLNIVLLNNNNYKISRIAEMSDNDITIQSRELALSTAENDEAINAFKVAMFQFNKVVFNTTYNNLLLTKNFREVFKEVFIPFLNHIGLLWQTDVLTPAHEHFITSLILQKLQLNIEKLQYNVATTDKTYVLFLPDNEIHELGLLYLNYELLLRGHKTIYLGQSLPIEYLDCFFTAKTELCFVTSLTVMPYDNKVEEFFDSIDDLFKNMNHKFIAIGQKINLVKDKKYAENIFFYSSVSDVLKVL